MFLRERTTQAEYFDDHQRTPAELRRHYQELARVNRFFRFERPFRLWLPRLLGPVHCRRLSLLDLGSGDGGLGRALTTWAEGQGWTWEFTNLDVRPVTRDLDPNPRHVIGTATAIPFPDGAFDAVIATTMTHHLDSEADVVAHFREAARVARRAVLLCDLHRNPAFHLALWGVLKIARLPPDFRSDGLLSIRRGWRVPEWRRLADLAGLPQARVWHEHGTRVLLSLVKDASEPDPPDSPDRPG